jgi:uncharacterized protein (TIGR03437 family)
VKVNGEYVPVLFASSSDVKFLCPALDAGTSLSVAVETSSGETEPLNATMQAVSPRIFSLDGSGQNQGSISFADTTDVVMARNFQVPAHPAQPGDRVLIWATGLGSVNDLSGRVLVKFGDLTAEAESIRPVSGYAGVYVIEARVPAGASAGDAIPVQLNLTAPDGRQSKSNSVTAAVELPE